MKHRTLWKVSVTTTVEAEDAVAQMLFRVFGTAASTYTDAETRATTVAVFCERRPSQLETKRIALRAGLCKIKGCGLDIGLGRIRVQEIPREDWAESWKRHFQPIEIGKALLIKPSWSKRRARAGQAVVVLDPGLSFGTGQHPTTEFCLLRQGNIIAERVGRVLSFPLQSIHHSMTAAAGGDEISPGLLRHLPGQNVFQISAGIAPNAWSKPQFTLGGSIPESSQASVTT